MSANEDPQGFIAWVSQRNPHIPLSDIEYLMDVSCSDAENFMNKEECKSE